MSVVIFGMAALVIDLGSGWRTRRALIPATDSVALAAVQNYVETGNQLADCSTVAGVNYLTANAATAALVGNCLWGGNSTQGYVLVTAEDTAPTWFAGVIGGGDFPVQSTSAAAYGPPSTVSGLRPIGLCFDSHPQLQQAVNAEQATTVTIQYGSNQPNGCGPVSGNWGIVTFTGGTPSNQVIQDQIMNGYDGPVSWDPHVPGSCNLGQEDHCVSLDPGAVSNSYQQELDHLVDNQIWFALPVFNFSEQAQTAGFPYYVHLAAIVRVRLVSYDLTGQQQNRSFTFEVEPGLVQGECCGSGGGAAGNKVVAMCATDPNDLSACTP
jgi:hypothetical protein